MEYKAASLADQVYERLETDILTGKYQPGEVLTEIKICNDLGISRTPVREAVRGLLLEHLVEIANRGSHGVRVVGISDQDFKDMAEVRLRIGGLAVRGFVHNRTDESLATLKEALDLQEFYLSKSDAEQMKTMDSRFHLVIYENCGSRVYRDILAPLHRKIQKYRRLALEHTDRARKSFEEHQLIYEAICAGDPDAAEERMNEHVRNAMNMILSMEDDQAG